MNSDNINLHTHILLGEDDFILTGLVQSMGRRSICPVIVMYRPDYMLQSHFAHKSRYAGDVYIVQSAEDGLRLVMEKYGNEPAKPFIYPVGEREIRLVDDHYHELKDKFLFFNGGDSGKLRCWFDKINQCSMALECGLLVPESEIVARGDVPMKVRYPVFVKATNSNNIGWKEDVGIFYSDGELMEAYNSFKGESFLMQQYIDKADEITLQGVSVNGGQEVYIPLRCSYERILKRDFSSYMHFEKCQDDGLVNKLTGLLRIIGYSGVFEAEFIESKDEHKYYFLEVNLRISAYCSGVAHGGANLPLIWAQATLDGHVDRDSIMLTDKWIYALDEVRDYNCFVYSGKISILKWFHNLLTADVLYHFDSNDPVPGILFYRDWLWPKFRRLAGKLFHKCTMI